MTWQPESPITVDTNESSKLEWIIRSFRKLSQWSSTRVHEGYGNLFLNAPLILNAPLTTTYQKLSAFDSDLDGPGVMTDKPNHRLAVSEPGVWFMSVSVTGTITPFSSNNAQTIEMVIYNETQSIAYIPGVFSVPRYGDVFTIGKSSLVKVPTVDGQYVANDWVSLWIRQRYASPGITVEDLEELELSVFRVSA